MEVLGHIGQVRTITAAYTVQPDDRIILLSSPGDFAVTLPLASTWTGKWLSFYYSKVAAAEDDVTVTAAGSDMICSEAVVASTVVLTAEGNHLQIFSDGYFWYTISKANT